MEFLDLRLRPQWLFIELPGGDGKEEDRLRSSGASDGWGFFCLTPCKSHDRRRGSPIPFDESQTPNKPILRLRGIPILN
jgi:hypothetical protein